MITLTTNFPADIENIVYMKDVNYIDAVIDWAQANNCDMDYVAELVKHNPLIKSKIELEAQDLGVIKKTARLPI